MFNIEGFHFKTPGRSRVWAGDSMLFTKMLIMPNFDLIMMKAMSTMKR